MAPCLYFPFIVHIAVLCKGRHNLLCRFLTPAPSTVSVERLFSDGGLVLDKKRNGMDPEHVNGTLFVRENYALGNFELDW